MDTADRTMTSAPRRILWDIYEEHLDEAAFLWGQWERALVAANYTLDQVIAGPEERLLAHLDGLVLGGRRVAERLLVPALDDDDEGKVFAGAWALAQAEDADHLDLVVERLPKAKPPAFAALARSLELSTRRDLPARLSTLWKTSDARVQGALIDILAPRDPAWAGARLETCLAAGAPAVQAAALRGLRGTMDRVLGGYVGEALSSPDANVRHEAIATGYAMRMPEAVDACRREALATGESCRLPLALLALAGTPADRELILSRISVPEARRHALWALGFFGVVEAADGLVAMLGDQDAARVAGESLSAITGIVVDGPMAKPGETKGPGVEDVQPDDPAPEALPEDLLRVPAASAVRDWWRGARGRFQPGVRYLCGKPWSEGAVRDALGKVAMWRRPALALEVMAKWGGSAVNVRGWGDPSGS